MTVFEKACTLSNDRWVSTIPEIIDDFDLSKKTQKNMSVLCNKMRNNKYHNLTRNMARLLVAAAIIVSLVSVAFASPLTRDFIVKKFADRSTYTVVSPYDDKIKDGLVLSYIPEGFTKTNEFVSDRMINYEYSKGDVWFGVEKCSSSFETTFDTEFYDSSTKEYNGIIYTLYKSSDVNNGIIWNYGDYVYIISGPISAEEVFNIAKSTK